MATQDTKISLSGLGQSYWSEKGGLHQAEWDKLSKLVPPQGKADTVNIELVRVTNRLYWDYCNNGNMNARNIITTNIECEHCSGSGIYTEFGEDDEEFGDTCNDCDGGGTVEDEEIEVSEFYQKFIDFILKYIPAAKPYMEKVEALITYYTGSDDEYYFSDYNMMAYDHIVDLVIDYVNNNKDKNLLED
jgi:hypothetical protein